MKGRGRNEELVEWRWGRTDGDLGIIYIPIWIVE
jgi:hypothetical protein